MPLESYPLYTDAVAQEYQNNPESYKLLKKVNLVEAIFLVTAGILLVASFSIGFSLENTINTDRQKEEDILAITRTLDEYYKNSHTIISHRSYPLAKCSEYPNEVDFESTLRLALTGHNPKLTTHTFIQSADYPKDPKGVYSLNLQTRRVDYRCEELLGVSSADENIYPDGYPSCNLNQAKKLNNCYVYTTTNNGDSYAVGYYQDSSKKYVLYKKYRDTAMQIVNGK